MSRPPPRARAWRWGLGVLLVVTALLAVLTAAVRAVLRELDPPGLKCVEQSGCWDPERGHCEPLGSSRCPAS